MNDQGRIDPFVTDLSLVNMVLSFSVSVFSYTIVLILQDHAIPVFLAGLGLSVGQGLSIATSMYFGRMNDRGHSYGLMIFGSVLYASILIILFIVMRFNILILIVVPVITVFIVIFEGMFRSSMNSFISKAVVQEKLASSFSRVNALEMIGSAASFAVLIYGAISSILLLIYLGSGLLLTAVAVTVFGLIHGDARSSMKALVSQVKRPGFMESFRRLRSRMDTIAPMTLTKGLTYVGMLSFMYFYVPTGVYIGINPAYSFAILMVTFILASAFSRYGEKILSNGVDFGRRNFTYAALNDLITYSLLLLSVVMKNDVLFIVSVLTSAPNPIFTSGAISYEVSVVGRENRGLYGSVQRMVIGLSGAFAIFPISFIFSVNITYLWLVIVGVSAAAVAVSVLIR